MCRRSTFKVSIAAPVRSMIVNFRFDNHLFSSGYCPKPRRVSMVITKYERMPRDISSTLYKYNKLYVARDRLYYKLVRHGLIITFNFSGFA